MANHKTSPNTKIQNNNNNNNGFLIEQWAKTVTERKGCDNTFPVHKLILKTLEWAGQLNRYSD